jgi:hypothetical protein
VVSQGGCIGEGCHLVDDHATTFGVIGRAVPGRLEHRIKGGRRTTLDRERELGDHLTLAGLLGHDAFPAHHVVSGDRLEQGALESLAARQHEISVVTGEPWSLAKGGCAGRARGTAIDRGG